MAVIGPRTLVVGAALVLTASAAGVLLARREAVSSLWRCARSLEQIEGMGEPTRAVLRMANEAVRRSAGRVLPVLGESPDSARPAPAALLGRSAATGDLARLKNLPGTHAQRLRDAAAAVLRAEILLWEEIDRPARPGDRSQALRANVADPRYRGAVNAYTAAVLETALTDPNIAKQLREVGRRDGGRALRRIEILVWLAFGGILLSTVALVFLGWPRARQPTERRR